MSLQLELQNGNVRLVDLQPGDINTDFNSAVAKTESNDPRVNKTWQAVERNRTAAPAPELVARQVIKLIEQTNPPPRVTVGDSFQAVIAPFIFRFLPQRVRIWGLKKYYGI